MLTSDTTSLPVMLGLSSTPSHVRGNTRGEGRMNASSDSMANSFTAGKRDMTRHLVSRTDLYSYFVLSICYVTDFCQNLCPASMTLLLRPHFWRSHPLRSHHGNRPRHPHPQVHTHAYTHASFGRTLLLEYLVTFDMECMTYKTSERGIQMRAKNSIVIIGWSLLGIVDWLAFDTRLFDLSRGTKISKIS